MDGGASGLLLGLSGPGTYSERGGIRAIIDPKLLQGFFRLARDLGEGFSTQEPNCMVPFCVFDYLVVGCGFMSIVHAFEHPALTYEDLSSPDYFRGGTTGLGLRGLRHLLIKVLGQDQCSNPNSFFN